MGNRERKSAPFMQYRIKPDAPPMSPYQYLDVGQAHSFAWHVGLTCAPERFKNLMPVFFCDTPTVIGDMKDRFDVRCFHANLDNAGPVMGQVFHGIAENVAHDLFHCQAVSVYLWQRLDSH